jgi:hypothetical protein
MNVRQVIKGFAFSLCRPPPQPQDTAAAKQLQQVAEGKPKEEGKQGSGLVRTEGRQLASDPLPLHGSWVAPYARQMPLPALLFACFPRYECSQVT